jgi:hypothetical protein
VLSLLICAKTQALDSRFSGQSVWHGPLSHQRAADGKVTFVGTQFKVGNIFLLSAFCFLLSAKADVSQLTQGFQTAPKWVPSVKRRSD